MLLLFPSGGSWGSERWVNLFKVTQLQRDRGRAQPESFRFQSPRLHHSALLHKLADTLQQSTCVHCSLSLLKQSQKQNQKTQFSLSNGWTRSKEEEPEVALELFALKTWSINLTNISCTYCKVIWSVFFLSLFSACPRAHCSWTNLSSLGPHQTCLSPSEGERATQWETPTQAAQRSWLWLGPEPLRVRNFQILKLPWANLINFCHLHPLHIFEFAKIHSHLRCIQEWKDFGMLIMQNFTA